MLPNCTTRTDLVAAWEQVPASTVAEHHRIANVFCEDEMYQNYVAVLSSSHAAIPYLGSWLALCIPCICF